MSTKTKVDALWDQFRTAINKAYAEADKSRDNLGTSLRDYAEDISWSDDLAGLLGRETANERQHRSNRPSVPGFSTETAAKLLIMSSANRGSKMTAMPSATIFLEYRKTMAEAEVIGYLIRKHIPEGWETAIDSLDYAKLMQA